MSFYETIEKYKKIDLETAFQCVTYDNVTEVLFSENMGPDQFISLLSPKAADRIEDIAQKAHETTLKYFGKTVQLYTPIYVSNYCDNHCIYCGFNAKNDIPRKKLTISQVEKEAESIASTGLKHILLLTGGSRKESPVSYVKDCVQALKKYFSAISIEIYALTGEEYKELICEGVDGLTIYQETYDEEVYGRMHPSGPKKDYCFRLDAPERAAREGMRAVNIGALFGLASWRKEAFLTGMHARYLLDKFPAAEIGVSLPRLRPHAGKFISNFEISDTNIAQVIMALRLFLPRQGITVSTREAPVFRENLLPLGVTRISAGSTTAVGGHTLLRDQGINDIQFQICDERGVDEIKEMLKSKGYQPVLKDWMPI
jgi:2-iminoacetate synthase